MIPVVEVDAARLNAADAAAYARVLAEHAERRPWIVMWPNGNIAKSGDAMQLLDSHSLWKHAASPPPGHSLWSLRDQGLEALDLNQVGDRKVLRGALDGWLLDAALRVRPYLRADFRRPWTPTPSSGHPVDGMLATASWLAVSPVPEAACDKPQPLVLFDYLMVDSLTSVNSKPHVLLANLAGLVGTLAARMKHAPSFAHLDGGGALDVILYSYRRFANKRGELGETAAVAQNIRNALHRERLRRQAAELRRAVARCGASSSRRVRIVLRELHPGALVSPTAPRDVHLHARLIVVPRSGHVIELPWGLDGLWMYQSEVQSCDRPRLLIDMFKNMARYETNPDLWAISEQLKRDEQKGTHGEIDLSAETSECVRDDPPLTRQDLARIVDERASSRLPQQVRDIVVALADAPVRLRNAGILGDWSIFDVLDRVLDPVPTNDQEALARTADAVLERVIPFVPSQGAEPALVADHLLRSFAGSNTALERLARTFLPLRERLSTRP